MIVQSAFTEVNLREASAPQKLYDLEVAELKGFVADGPLQEGRSDGEFLDVVVDQVLEGGVGFAVYQLS